MYTAFSWELHRGPKDLNLLKTEIGDCFRNRSVRRLLANTVAAGVRNGIDFLELNEKLGEIAQRHPGQFYFSLFAINANSAYRGQKPPMFAQACVLPPLSGGVPAIAAVMGTLVDLAEVLGTKAVEN